jgi:uncharacterized membrane protein YebE (DUF533 family)
MGLIFFGEQMEEQENTINDSRFNMWRAVFAMAHVDGFLAIEEQGMLYNYIEQNPFSEEQKDALREDVATPQDVVERFEGIEEQDDRVLFFELARAIVWCDGNFDEQEQQILDKLKEIHEPEALHEELKESRQTFLVQKLHDVFMQSGLNGLADKITKDGPNG